MMSENRKIESSKLLLVEGIEDLHLIEEIIQYMVENESGCENLSSIQLWNYDGADNLKTNLKLIRSSREYHTLLSTIAITSDAESDANRKFQSITTRLKDNKYSVPLDQLAATESNPSVILLIIPSDGQGMIEDVCLRSVCDDPAMVCVDNFFKCLNSSLPQNGLDLPTNCSKARLQAFLASRKKAGLRMGTAAKKKLFPFNDPAFDEIKQLLKLMI